MMENESAYEEQIKTLRSKLVKNQFDSEHHHEKHKRSTQSLISEKDKAIEQLLSQLRDHNDLLQELHENLQKEQEKFKNELENLNNGYEKIIDDASEQIEEFMNKNNFS